MARKYWDPINGNDANDGSSFANRVKTYLRINTVAANGDEVVVAKAPVLLSSVAARIWDNTNQLYSNTNNALGYAEIVDNFDSTTGWVASTGVTLTATTTNSHKCNSTPALNIATTGSYAGGKLCYKALSLTANGALEVLSCYIQFMSAISDRAFEIRLCSDAIGDVPLHTFNIDGHNGASANNQDWEPWAVNVGAMGAVINSISVSSTGAGSGSTVLCRINNLVRTYPKTDSRYLGHDVAFRIKCTTSGELNSNALFLVREISGQGLLPAVPSGRTGVFLETIGGIGTERPSQAGQSKYVSATLWTMFKEYLDVTVDKYLLQTYFDKSATTASTKSITYYGGLNDTDMTTRDNDRDMSIPYVLGGTAFKTLNSTSTAVGMSHMAFLQRHLLPGGVIDFNQCYFGYSPTQSMSINAIATKKALGHFNDTLFTSNQDFTISVVNSVMTYAGAFMSHKKIYLTFGGTSSTPTISNNAGGRIKDIFVQGAGQFFSSGAIIKIENLYVNNTNGNGTNGNLCVFGIDCSSEVKTCTIYQSPTVGTPGLWPTFDTTRVVNKVRKITYDVSGLTTFSTSSQNNSDSGRVEVLDNNGAGAMTDSSFGQFYSQATTRHTASGLAWTIKPTSSTLVSEDSPFTVKIASFYAKPTKYYKVRVWLYRTNASTVVSFYPSVWNSPYEASPYTHIITASGGSGLSSWVQYELTLPVSALGGPVEIMMSAYGSTAVSHIDDIEIQEY